MGGRVTYRLRRAEFERLSATGNYAASPSRHPWKFTGNVPVEPAAPPAATNTRDRNAEDTSPEASHVSDGAEVARQPHDQQDYQHNPERRPAVDADSRVAVAPAAENGGNYEKDDEKGEHMAQTAHDAAVVNAINALAVQMTELPGAKPDYIHNFMGFCTPGCPCGRG